jgi:hypothetical protein
MKNTIHLVLVSTQAIPNITPILDERYRPDQVIMLLPKSMEAQADQLERIYKPRGVEVSRWLIDDAWDVEHIRTRVIDLLAENESSNIALNATCGTRPMSIAAYEAFRTFEKPIFYVHMETDHLIWMYPHGQPSVDLHDHIQLKEYLLCYGATHVNEGYKEGVIPSLRDLTLELVDNIKKYEPALATINYYAAMTKKGQLSSPTIEAKQSSAFWRLVELFQQADLLESKNGQLIFKDEASRFIVNGGWLEMYAYACCVNLKQKLVLQDLAHSIEVGRSQEGNTVLNELDVAFLKDNRLYLLECKTKRFDGNNLKHDEGAEVLYKLASIRDLLGGMQAKSMLVSFRPLKPHNRHRAKELDVETCCYEELRFLEEKIASWILASR